MKKRILALIMAGMLVLSSCGKKTEEQTTTAAETTPAAVADTAETNADEAAPESEAEQTEEQKAPIETDITPAVWKVTDPESGNSMNMMGTIHIVPESEAIVPQYVMDIYNESDGVAVEYDVTKVQSDMVVQIKYLSYFVLSDGTLITDHLSAEAYEGAKNYLTEAGYYNEAFDSYNAAYWESLLTSASVMTIEGMKETGVDSYFIGLAKQDGKEVRDIEELEDQMNAITANSDDLSDYNIKEMLKVIEDGGMGESFMELYDMWAKGDVDGFTAADAEAMTELPEELKDDYEVYNDLMMTRRNIGMAEKAAEYIKNGDNIFYMVGFAHFCGEGSVIDLLEKDGFTVERIY